MPSLVRLSTPNYKAHKCDKEDNQGTTKGKVGHTAAVQQPDTMPMSNNNNMAFVPPVNEVPAAASASNEYFTPVQMMPHYLNFPHEFPGPQFFQVQNQFQAQQGQFHPFPFMNQNVFPFPQIMHGGMGMAPNGMDVVSQVNALNNYIANSNAAQAATHNAAKTLLIGKSDDGCDIVPRIEDILFGRGRRINNHPGNIRFREVVDKYKLEYHRANRVDKQILSRRIVAALRNATPPSRFLIKDKETNTWDDAGDKLALRKVTGALREKGSEHRVEECPQDSKLAENPLIERRVLSDVTRDDRNQDNTNKYCGISAQAKEIKGSHGMKKKKRLEDQMSHLSL